MPGSELPEVFAAQVIFWILLPIVLFGPARWAVVAWLVMGNLDTTGPAQSASATVGLINATKGLLLPGFLLWRLRKTPGQITDTTAARLWLALIAYAAVATIWTPFPLASAKLIGNMVGILLAFVVLEKSARKGLLGGRSLTTLIAVSLTLGAIQTYYFGGVTYGFDGADQPSRFSSFVGAQQYASFLVAFVAIVLWQRGIRARTRTALCSALFVALLLNGSRVWFFGALIVLALYVCLSFRRVAVFVAFSVATVLLFVFLLVNVANPQGNLLLDSSGRIVATATAVLAGQDSSHNVGLRNLNFRLAIYQRVIEELRTGSTAAILFGHGTSSGGNVVLSVYPASYAIDSMDLNRAIHNEWLRALYEWGVTGSVLLVGVFATVFAGLVARYREAQWKAPVSAVLSVLPAFLAAICTENVLAGAGNAVTLSLAIVTALLWIPFVQRTSANGKTLVRA